MNTAPQSRLGTPPARGPQFDPNMQGGGFTRPRANTRRLPTLRERQQSQAAPLDDVVVYDGSSAMARLSRKFGRKDRNDPLVGMSKPFSISAASVEQAEDDDDEVDYSQFTNTDEAEGARVARLKDMEGLFQIKVKQTTKSASAGDDDGQRKTTTKMLDDNNQRQSRADRYGWRLRYLRLTNNLSSGNKWERTSRSPSAGPSAVPPSLAGSPNSALLGSSSSKAASPDGAVANDDYSQFRAASPSDSSRAASGVVTPTLSQSQGGRSSPVSPLEGTRKPPVGFAETAVEGSGSGEAANTAATTTPQPTASATGSEVMSGPPNPPTTAPPTRSVSMAPGVGAPPTASPLVPATRLMPPRRAHSASTTIAPMRSVVDMDAAVLEIYHVEVNHATRTFTIKSKAMAIPLKKMTLIKRGALEQKRALQFPSDESPTGSEYKYGHLRLEVMFDIDTSMHHQHGVGGVGAGVGSRGNSAAGTPSSTDRDFNRGGVGGPHGGPAAGGGGGGGGGAPAGGADEAAHTTTNRSHYELSVITNTAKERDMWYDWISSFILHADLVDLHTDKPKIDRQYVLRRPTAGVANFISFFLSGKKKADALGTVIGGISVVGGAIGAGFKPLMSASGIAKAPNGGEIFIVTPHGPQLEHRCKISCNKIGECVLMPLDAEDVDRVTIPLAKVDVIVTDPLTTTLFLHFKDAEVAGNFSRQCGPLLDADTRDYFDDDDDFFNGPERDREGYLLLPQVEFRLETCYDRDQMADWFTKINGKNQPKSTPYIYERPQQAGDWMNDGATDGGSPLSGSPTRFTFSKDDPSKGSPTTKDLLKGGEGSTKDGSGPNSDEDDDEWLLDGGHGGGGGISLLGSGSDAGAFLAAAASELKHGGSFLAGLIAQCGEWLHDNGTAHHNSRGTHLKAATGGASGMNGAKQQIHLLAAATSNWLSQGAHGGPTIPQRYSRSDPRSLLTKLPVCYYKKRPHNNKATKGVTLSEELLKGQLSVLANNTAVFANQPPPGPDGSRFISAELLDILVRPLQGWATVGYAEIGSVPSGRGGFARRAIAADYPQQTILVLEGEALEEVVVRLRFADITCVTAYSKAFGGMGFTIHCLQTGVELIVLPCEDEGVPLQPSLPTTASAISASTTPPTSTARRWLDMLDMAGCNVKADKTREDVNNAYLRDLKDERAKLDAMAGVDLCERNEAMVQPCGLCGKKSYVCDTTAMFHPDAVRRLAVISKQQGLQNKKALLQQLEDDFATTSSSDDEVGGLAGVVHTPRGGGGKRSRRVAAVRPKLAELPRLDTWVIASLPPQQREVPINPFGNPAYINKVIADANEALAAGRRSMRVYDDLLGSNRAGGVGNAFVSKTPQ